VAGDHAALVLDRQLLFSRQRPRLEVARDHRATSPVSECSVWKGRAATLKGFREFAIKGNVLDMAVGIIIGAAFGRIVASLVEDAIMPPIGLVLGKVGFANIYLSRSGQHHDSLEAANAAGAAVIRCGAFLNQTIGFVIVAFAVFLIVKAVNRLRKQDETVEEAAEQPCPFCQIQIPIAATRCLHCTSQLGAA
jgi:large conductance mechanosensitive channel